MEVAECLTKLDRTLIVYEKGIFKKKNRCSAKCI